MNKNISAQQGDAPDRVTFSIIATAPSHKIENIDRQVIVDVGQTRMTFRESLRDIESCLRAVPAKLYHLGIRGTVLVVLSGLIVGRQ